MLQNIPKDKILDALKEGPTYPSKIVKKVGGDTMLIGAILSTLINSGDVKISSLKIGGSPLYYLPGHEAKLEEFINYLNDKDQKTFIMLKEKKLLQESAQDPLTRVSLRTIKDFARTLEIEFNGKKETFWRFYQYDKEQALEEAKKIMLSQLPLEPKKEATASEVKVVPQPGQILSPEIEIIGGKAKKQKDPIHHKKHYEKKEDAPQDQKASAQVVQVAEQSIVKPEKIELPKADEIATSKPQVQDAKHDKDVTPGQGDKTDKDSKEDFFDTLKKYFHEKNLDVINREKMKKSEYTLVLKNHDANEYIYCVAKDKKNVNEGDLSTAFVFAQSKKMPCMFIMTGSLTKKAESMIHREFKDMKIEKI